MLEPADGAVLLAAAEKEAEIGIAGLPQRGRPHILCIGRE